MDTQLHAPRTPKTQHAHPKRRRHPHQKRQNLNHSHHQRQKIQRRNSRRTHTRRTLQRCRHGFSKPVPIDNQSLEPWLPKHSLSTPRMPQQPDSQAHHTGCARKNVPWKACSSVHSVICEFDGTNQEAKTKPCQLSCRSWYNITQGALKVILNASYGVFGADSFDLYCPPVAEATAAIGRHSITQILNRAEAIGIQVLVR